MDGSVKVRIFLWRHREKDKDFLWSDAPSISFELFRLIPSIAAEKGGPSADWT